MACPGRGNRGMIDMISHYVFGETRKEERPLTGEDLDGIFLAADRASGKIQELPVDKIMEVLDNAANHWLRRDSPARREALERMPSICGYSREMTEAAIDSLFTMMKRENLYRTVRAHLGGSSYLDRFEYTHAHEGYIKAQPLGCVLHVNRGDLFTGGVESLIYGLLSKNVNILRLTRQDPLFPLLFARSLREVDEPGHICNSFAVLDLTGGGREMDGALISRCDGVVMLGGGGQDWSRDIPRDKRLVVHGPGYGIAIITSDGLKEADASRVLDQCALDVAMWEQKAPSSPHVIYVEKDVADAFLVKFPSHLEKISHRFPQENLPMEEKVKILKVREEARFMEAEGKGVLHRAHRSHRWTVVFEESPDFRVSCRNRTIYVKPFSSWADILSQALKMKEQIQTVGVLATPPQLRMLSKALSRIGVSRITPVGGMSTRKAWAPRNFEFPLRSLVKWISIEGIDRRFDLGDRIAPARPPVSRWDRLKNLLRYARDNSPFYAGHLKDVSVGDISGYAGFLKVPLLSAEDLQNNSPPAGDGLLTGPLANAYVFASGGSTARPRFSFYSYREMEEVSSIMAEIFLVAGLSRDDTTANLFTPAAMWDSLMVANQALEKIGCVSLPVEGYGRPEVILDYFRLLKPGALVGPPGVILGLARHARETGTPLAISKILYSGDPLGDEEVELLKSALGARIVQTTGYASLEGGPVGYKTPQDKGCTYRLLYEYMFLEVIDPSTLLPVERGGAGEIVITNFHRQLMPIIRYRTGERGRIIPRPADGGPRILTFEHLGKL